MKESGMKSHISVALLVAALFVFSGAVHKSGDSGPFSIDLNQPGDALVLTLNGKHVGGLRVDAQGRLGIYGPNQSSTAITVDDKDRVQIDPAPVENPPVRLSVANDMWATGVLRIGRADAFGDTPLDPNGAIQLGRNLKEAQPMSVLRAFGQGKERFRIGITGEGDGFWSNGPHDTPLVTFTGQSEDKSTPAAIRFHAPTESNTPREAQP